MMKGIEVRNVTTKSDQGLSSEWEGRSPTTISVTVM